MTLIIIYSFLLSKAKLLRAGFDLGTTGRLSLMAKLAEGTGMKLPEQTRNALSVKGVNRYGLRCKF